MDLSRRSLAWPPRGIEAQRRAALVRGLRLAFARRVSTPTDALSALRRIPLLASLPNAELERLASRAKQVQHEAGDELVKEGTSGASAYFIAEGTCEVRRKRGGANRRVATLGPGDFFGELAIVDPSPRTASVIATDALSAFVLEGYDFLSALKANKGMALHLVKVLASRLRAQEDEFAAYRP